MVRSPFPLWLTLLCSLAHPGPDTLVSWLFYRYTWSLPLAVPSASHSPLSAGPLTSFNPYPAVIWELPWRPHFTVQPLPLSLPFFIVPHLLTYSILHLLWYCLPPPLEWKLHEGRYACWFCYCWSPSFSKNAWHVAGNNKYFVSEWIQLLCAWQCGWANHCLISGIHERAGCGQFACISSLPK